MIEKLPALLNTAQAARLVGFSVRQFRRRVMESIEPVVFHGTGHQKHFWRRTDCLQWKAKHEQH